MPKVLTLPLPYPTTLPDPTLLFAKGRLMNIFAWFLRVERVGGVELTAYPEVRMEIYVCVCVYKLEEKKKAHNQILQNKICILKFFRKATGVLNVLSN